MTSLFRNDQYIHALMKVLGDRDLTVDDRVRVIVALNEQQAARSLTYQADYLQRMGISLRLLFEISGTSTVELNVLSASKLRDLNLVNVK
jgi:hypothetical protein